MAYVFLKDVQNMPDAYSIVIKFQALIQASIEHKQIHAHIYICIYVYICLYISVHI